MDLVMKTLKILQFSLLILVIPSLVFAQTKPEISIVAPTKVNRNSYLFQMILTVENEDELPPKSKMQHNWQIFEDGNLRDNAIVVEGGTRAIIPTGNAEKITYKVTSKYAYDIKKPLKVTDKDGKAIEDAKVFIGDAKTPSKEVTVATKTVESDEIFGEVKIEGVLPTPPTPGPGPGPNPPPDPTPTPNPVFPPGEFGLAQANYDIAMQSVPVADRTKAGPLADAFEKIARRISTSQSKLAAGVALTADDLKLDMDSIMKEIRQANATALGNSAPAWEDWNSKFGDKVFELFSANRLTTPAQFKTAFIETALGLRQVR
jgi:hypothetical protein